MEIKNRTKVLQWLLFITVFSLSLIYLHNKDMLQSSDAADVWKTIKSYGNPDMYGSYVLYKGMGAVFPYVWLYRLAKILCLQDFFFIKVFHAFMFSLSSIVFLPNIYYRISKKPVNTIGTIFLPFICFFFWEYTGIFSWLMIDLPSFTLFLASVSEVLNFTSSGTERCFPLWRHVLLSILLGLGFGFSGQYTIATIFIVVYFTIIYIKKNRQLEKKMLGMLIKLGLILMLICVPITMNSYFMKSFVEPLRSSGSWIPDNKAWAKRAFSIMLDNYTLFFNNGDIPSNRGGSIIIDAYGNEYLNAINTSRSYNYLGKIDLLKLYLRHPLDMIVIWINRLFIGLSPDSGTNNIPSLFLFYSFMFITLKQGLAYLRQGCTIYSPEVLIILAFIATAAAPVIMVIETRYVVALQSFFIAFGCLSLDCKSALLKLRQIFFFPSTLEPLVRIKERQALFLSFFAYLVFLFLCFSRIGNLYELRGMVPSNVLFSWKIL